MPIKILSLAKFIPPTVPDVAFNTPCRVTLNGAEANEAFPK